MPGVAKWYKKVIIFFVVFSIRRYFNRSATPSDTNKKKKPPPVRGNRVTKQRVGFGKIAESSSVRRTASDNSIGPIQIEYNPEPLGRGKKCRRGGFRCWRTTAKPKRINYRARYWDTRRGPDTEIIRRNYYSKCERTPRTILTGPACGRDSPDYRTAVPEMTRFAGIVLGADLT